MLKRFFKDGLIYSANDFIQKGIAIFLVPVYTRFFSPSDYGIIDIVMVMTTLLQLTIALEITQGMARYYRETKNDYDKTAYASSAFWFTFATNSLFLLLAWSFSKPLSSWVFGESDKVFEFKIAMISIFLAGILYFAQNLLRWQMKSKQFSIVAITTTITTVVLKLLFVVILKMELLGVFYGLVAGQLVGSLLAICFAHRSYKLLFDFERFKTMVSYSYPLVLSGIGVYISLYVDRIAIKELLSLHEVGLYGIGFRVSSIVTLLIAGFHGAFTPLVYAHYKEKDTPAKISKIFRYFVAAALVASLGLSIYAKELLIIFTTEDYYSGYIVVPFLVAAKLIYAMYIFSPGLGIAKKTSYISAINIFVAILNILLNLLLIPIIGIIGAALATLISAIINFSLYFNKGNQYYKIPYEWKKIFMALPPTIILIIIGLLIPTTSLTIVTMKAFLVLLGSLVVLSVLIGKDEINQLISIYKYKKRQ